MNSLVATVALGVLWILELSPLPVHASAQASDPTSVLSAFLKAFNGDTNAGLALVTDDAVVRIIPPPPGTSGVWTGKGEISQLLMFSKEQNATQEIIGSPHVDGNRVSATVMVLTNDFRNWGIGPVEHTYEAIVEDGKIKSLDAAIAPSEQARVAAAANAYFATHPPAGMPRTGDKQMDGGFLLLIGLGILAVLTGLNLRNHVVPRADR